jgi:hypothetical protein
MDNLPELVSGFKNMVFLYIDPALFLEIRVFEG